MMTDVSDITQNILRELFKRERMNASSAAKILERDHKLKLTSAWIRRWKSRVFDKETKDSIQKQIDIKDKIMNITSLESINENLHILYTTLESLKSISPMDSRQSDSIVKLVDEIKDLHEHKRKYFGELETKKQITAIINGIIEISLKVLTSPTLEPIEREKKFKEYEDEIKKFLSRFGIESE